MICNCKYINYNKTIYTLLTVNDKTKLLNGDKSSFQSCARQFLACSRTLFYLALLNQGLTGVSALYS